MNYSAFTMWAMCPANFIGTDLTTRKIVVSNTNHKSPPTQFSPASYYFLSLRLKHLPQYSAVGYCRLYFPLNVTDQVSRGFQTTYL